MQRFLPLARQLARRYQRGSEPLDDLIQVASLGLLKAIDRFEPERPTAFSSFAVPTILGELKRHFRDRGWSVRVPRDLQEMAVRVDRVAEELARAARPRADAGGDRRAHRHHHRAACSRRARPPAPTGRSRSTARATTTRTATGMAESMGVEDPGFGLAEDAATVERLMTVLSDREREVLRLRFAEDLTQSEIGAARRRLADARLAPDPPGGGAAARGGRGRARRRVTVALRRVRSRPWSTGTCGRSTVEPHQPRILHSARGEARSIAINLPAGESLQEHQVHERAYLVVVDGEIEVARRRESRERRRRDSPPCSIRTNVMRCARRRTRGCCSCWRHGRATAIPGHATRSVR